MNVFKAEWRFQWKSLLLWSLSIVSFILLFMTLYPTFSEEAAIFKAMMDSLPPEMMNAMGIHVDQLFSDAGFMAYIYTYVQLMLAILATLWGITLLGREKIEGVSEFLLVKPLSRKRMFWFKTALGSVILFILHLVITLVITLVALSLQMPKESLLKGMQMVLLGGIMSLCFYSLGIVISCALKQISNPQALASSIGFGMFLLLLMSRLMGIEQLGWLTPLYHADPQRLLSKGFDVLSLLLLISVSMILLGIGYILFVKQDVEA